VRNHGWAGDPPASDEEAVRRILDAARRCIERRGDLSISVVAREVGVTRQTVYRYFRSADDLGLAAILDASTDFLHHVDARLADHLDLADLVVECIIFTVEEMPDDPYLGLMLNPGRVGVLREGPRGEAALRMGRSILERFPVPWPADVTDQQLDEVVELMLRLARSLIADPGSPPRTGDELRSVVHRWVAPVIRSLSPSLVPSHRSTP
jgi:AcrR family transcriptional regulator